MKSRFFTSWFSSGLFLAGITCCIETYGILVRDSPKSKPFSPIDLSFLPRYVLHLLIIGDLISKLEFCMRRVSLLLFSLFLLLVPSLWGARFAAGVAYPVGHNVCAVSVGDFNNDGRLDIMAADKTSLNILLGNGDGTFLSPISTSTATNAACFNPVVADFNGDGKLDVGVASSNGKIRIFLGSGNGTFQTIGQSGPSPGSMGIGDFNEDGIIDVLLTDPNVNCGAIVGLGNGDGTFRPGARINVSACFVVAFPFAIGDFNGDGHQDVLLVEEGEGIVTDYKVALGNGNGTFQKTLIRSTQNSAAGYIIPINFNGDAAQDLVIANNDSGIGSQLNQGNATFKTQFPTYCSLSNEVESMALGDFNDDSIPDVVMAQVGGAPLVIGFGQAGGKFTGCGTYDGGPLSFSVATGDFNGDGATDIVSGNFVDPGSVTVLIATP